MTNRTIVTIAACLFLVACAAAGIWSGWDSRDGECVRDRPWKLIAGSIRGGGSGFLGGGSQVIYYLKYAGTYKHSGNKCVSWTRVTESRYAREFENKESGFDQER